MTHFRPARLKGLRLAAFMATLSLLPWACAPLAHAIVVGPDDRQEVTTDKAPFSAIGFLLNGLEDCTATVVAKRFALTTQHCVRLPGGDVNDRLSFLPAFVDNVARARFGRPLVARENRIVRAKVVKTGAFAGPNAAIAPAADWAVLELAEAMSDPFALFDARANAAPAAVSLAGYGLDFLQRFGTMGLDVSCRIGARDTGLFSHECDTAEGASGAPLYVVGNDGKFVLVGIHIGARDDRNVALSIEHVAKDLRAAMGQGTTPPEPEAPKPDDGEKPGELPRPVPDVRLRRGLYATDPQRFDSSCRLDVSHVEPYEDAWHFDLRIAGCGMQRRRLHMDCNRKGACFPDENENGNRFPFAVSVLGTQSFAMRVGKNVVLPFTWQGDEAPAPKPDPQAPQPPPPPPAGPGTTLNLGRYQRPSGSRFSCDHVVTSRQGNIGDAAWSFVMSLTGSEDCRRQAERRFSCADRQCRWRDDGESRALVVRDASHYDLEDPSDGRRETYAWREGADRPDHVHDHDHDHDDGDPCGCNGH